MAFSQIAWQQTANDSSPTTAGIAGSITVTLDGTNLTGEVREDPTTPGRYYLEYNPYEILDTGTKTETWTSTEAGVTFPTLTPDFTDPADLSTENQYCTIYDVYLQFGSDNVNKWADKNNRRDTNEIAQAIIDQIVESSADIDDRMRNKIYQTIPFETPYPKTIVDICRLMTGYELHFSRGIEDEDQSIQAANDEAEKKLRQILAGQIQFDLPMNKTAGAN